VQYAKQFLAEEKRRDKKSKKVKWQQIGGRDNHLLDCEVYAAACAESSWTPSIRYLAKIEETKKTETKSKSATKPEPQATEIDQAGSTRGDDMVEKTLNVMETAEMISCSRSCVYRLLEAGEITGYYTGNRRGLRIIVRSVDEFIERRKDEYAVMA
jgi:excisionase family DNA binding protein